MSLIMGSLVLGAVLATAGTGTTNTTPPKLQLRNGPVLTADQPRTEVATRLLNLAERLEESHLVVRLSGNVDGERRETLARSGLRLLSPLGSGTWIATSDHRTVGNVPELARQIAWIDALPDTWKLHPFLSTGGFPEWTVDQRAIEAFEVGDPYDAHQLMRQLAEQNDPPVVLYVLGHADVPAERLALEVRRNTSGEVLSLLKSVNGVVTRLPFSEIGRLAGTDSVLWIEPALPPLVERNDSARLASEVDELHAEPYAYLGSGVSVMVYDGNVANASHPDFGDRLSVREDTSVGNHATWVSGVIAGDGSASGGVYRGMAPAATIQSYKHDVQGEGWLYSDPSDIEEDFGDALNVHGAVIANVSLGTNVSFNGFPCEWTGDYNVTSSVIDAVVRGSLGAPFRVVWSAGNERSSARCEDEQIDGGYHSIVPPAGAKNHITVGAINSDDESMTSFSSWGPTDDGRIKPDLTASGCQVSDDGGITTTSVSGYATVCGTSFSAPVVTGIGALVIEAWRERYPGRQDLQNSSLKALLANTGADLGNPGPDCQFGYGTVRARAAIDAVLAGAVVESDVTSGETTAFTMEVPEGQPEIRLTLAWDDHAGIPLSSRALVNDLDLVLLDPDGGRHFPWTIDPADPAAPAVQDAEDHLNNIEQITVLAPLPGTWQVQVVGTDVPLGPQAFGIVTSPASLSGSSTAMLTIDQTVCPVEGEIEVTVVDADRNEDDLAVDFVKVFATSELDPDGNWYMLFEDENAMDSGLFSGLVSVSGAEGTGVVQVEHGSVVEVVYVDNVDADGNESLTRRREALIDGEVQPPVAVEILETQQGGFTLAVSVDEPVRVIVHHGESCDDLDQYQEQWVFSRDHTFDVTGLASGSGATAAFRIELIDEAGNSAVFDDAGECWLVTLPEFPTSFTELFSAGIDLRGKAIRWVPDDSLDQYGACIRDINALPVLPFDGEGSSRLLLGDDDSIQIDLRGGIYLYGKNYPSVRVNSNGLVHFCKWPYGDEFSAYESAEIHLAQPQISALWDDFDPSSGGEVWKTELPDGSLVFTWWQVPEKGTSNQNTFQLVLRPGGTIEIAWMQLATNDAVIGLSGGQLTSQNFNFIPFDLSEADSGCDAHPPHAHDVITTTGSAGVEIHLAGADDGAPDPPGQLTYTIESLPSVGQLRDGAAVISAMDLPYDLSPGVRTVRYLPQVIGGPDQVQGFEYTVDDGGVAPTGGVSAPGKVSVFLETGREDIYVYPLDEDPFPPGAPDPWSDFSRTLWYLWGVPSGLGGGGQCGNPNPTAGATGPHAISLFNGNVPRSPVLHSLKSPWMDCTNLYATRVEFQRWLNVGPRANGMMGAAVAIQYPGSWPIMIFQSEDRIQDDEWTNQSFDVASFMDGQPQVRLIWGYWHVDSFDFCEYSGWNIDDIVVSAHRRPFMAPGDVNGDGEVNGEDLGLMLGDWGRCTSEECPADFNGDGVVDGVDLGIMLGAWSS
jgi:hypothetical protein